MGLFFLSLISCGDQLDSQKSQDIRPPETKLGVLKALKVRCNVDLNSSDQKEVLSNESEPFTEVDATESESQVEIDFAPYVLISGFRDTDTFCATLYKSGEIESQVCHSGLTANVAIPLTTLASQPSDFTFQGKQIQLIDYKCVLADIGVQ